MLVTSSRMALSERTAEMRAKPTALPLNSEEETRFWSKVDQSAGPDACWPWMRATNDGYGVVTIRYKQYSAHRIAWELTNRPMTPDEEACHSCDNPPCCNPGHIWPGTTTQNAEDRVTKGRTARHFGSANGAHQHRDRLPRGDAHYARRHPELMARGESHGQAKLTAEQVETIRREYARGGESQEAIGRRLGVSQSLVSKIVRGVLWAE
jgi:hypothetical protein